MKDQQLPHPVPYVAIYRAPTIEPQAELTVKLSGVRLNVRTGPFSFSHAAPMKSLGPSRGMIVKGGGILGRVDISL